MYHKMKMIRSENHEIYSLEINKKSLSSSDDKRYICTNGIESFAYGHFFNLSIKCARRAISLLQMSFRKNILRIKVT